MVSVVESSHEMSLLLLFLLLRPLCHVYCHGFTIPEATLEFLNPTGLKMSIPETDPDVSLVAYHVNVNQAFYGVEAGQWARDVLRTQNGRWSTVFQDVRVKPGDTVNYWVYAIRNGLGYQNLFRSYIVAARDLQTSPVETTTGKYGPYQTTNKYETTTQRKEHYETTNNYESTTGEYGLHQSTNNYGLYESTTGRYGYIMEPDSLFESPAVPVDWRNCEMSLTTVKQHVSEQPPCSGQTVFSDNFNSSSDFSQWDYEVHIAGKYQDDAFTVFAKEGGTSEIRENLLVIKPRLLEDIYSENFVSTGNLTFEGCTMKESEFCSSKAVSYLILPPILSTRLTTKNSFSFQYGVVEIEAKLPTGDWIVPELWLEPMVLSYSNKSGRIVLGLSRGNSHLTVNGKDIANQLLEAGVVIDSSNNRTFQKTHDSNWADNFHVFKLVWTPDVMEFLVDEQLIGRLQKEMVLDQSLGGGKLAPFDKEFYISVGVHVGGLQDFPDEAISGNQPKPWKNTDPKARLKFWQAKDSWLTTWDRHSTLELKSITVTAL